MSTHSNYTGRFPRTLQESSFGPYATWQVERPFFERHAALIAVVVFFLVVGACLAIELL